MPTIGSVELLIDVFSKRAKTAGELNQLRQLKDLHAYLSKSENCSACKENKDPQYNEGVLMPAANCQTAECFEKYLQKYKEAEEARSAAARAAQAVPGPTNISPTTNIAKK